MDLKKNYEILCQMRYQAANTKVRKDWMILLDKTCEAMAVEMQTDGAQEHSNKDVIVKTDNMITLVEWSHRKGVNPETARKYANIGKLPAKRFGRDWIISEDVEPDNYKPNKKSN